MPRNKVHAHDPSPAAPVMTEEENSTPAENSREHAQVAVSSVLATEVTSHELASESHPRSDKRSESEEIGVTLPDKSHCLEKDAEAQKDCHLTPSNSIKDTGEDTVEIGQQERVEEKIAEDQHKLTKDTVDLENKQKITESDLRYNQQTLRPERDEEESKQVGISVNATNNKRSNDLENIMSKGFSSQRHRAHHTDGGFTGQTTDDTTVAVTGQHLENDAAEEVECHGVSHGGISDSSELSGYRKKEDAEHEELSGEDKQRHRKHTDGIDTGRGADTGREGMTPEDPGKTKSATDEPSDIQIEKYEPVQSVEGQPHSEQEDGCGPCHPETGTESIHVEASGAEEDDSESNICEQASDRENSAGSPEDELISQVEVDIPNSNGEIHSVRHDSNTTENNSRNRQSPETSLAEPIPQDGDVSSLKETGIIETEEEQERESDRQNHPWLTVPSSPRPGRRESFGDILLEELGLKTPPADTETQATASTTGTIKVGQVLIG